MKREQIINKVKEVARQITSEQVEVFTNLSMYPNATLQSL